MDMKKTNVPKSEFDLFRKMVEGELRPFLPEFSRHVFVSRLLEEALADGKIRRDITEHPALDLVFDDDVSEPPDLKAEYFLELIQNEFFRIQCSSRKMLEDAASEEEISLYANKNIQIAKAIGVDAHRLFNELLVQGYEDDLENVVAEYEDGYDNPNTYIMEILKLYIIRSIEYFQFLFRPYLKIEPLTEEDLLFDLYDKLPVRFTTSYQELLKREGQSSSTNEEDMKAFMVKHQEKLNGEKISEIQTKESNRPVLLSNEVTTKIRELKDKEGGKVLASRLGIPERTLYDIIKGKASAKTIRRISKADPQFMQIS